MHFAFNRRLLYSSRSSWSLFSGASELPMYENVMDIKFYTSLPYNYYGNFPINQYFSYIRFMFMNWSRKYACARWVFFFLVARFLGTSFSSYILYEILIWIWTFQKLWLRVGSTHLNITVLLMKMAQARTSSYKVNIRA